MRIVTSTAILSLLSSSARPFRSLYPICRGFTHVASASPLSHLPRISSRRSMSSSGEIRTNTPRILSIQSHTVHGFVGNKAATFPLQTMGFDVDCINTVSLSNHPAYSKSCKGQMLDAEVLGSIVQGLQDNDLLHYDAIITGYTRSMAHLEQIESCVRQIRASNPDAIYLCDPVLGDNEAYYVPAELTAKYKECLLPLATVITPNFFECQVLSGVTIRTFADAVEACRVLHSLGPEICVMTGLQLENTFATPHLAAILSYQPKQGINEDDATKKTTPTSPIVFRVDIPKIDRLFVGSGDLFSAFTAAGIHTLRQHFRQAPHLLGNILEISAHGMSQVLQHTKARNSWELSIVESAPIFRNMTDMYSKLLATHPSLMREQLTDDVEWHHAYIADSGNVAGVIFDMDGTLTEPGAIDFNAMYERNGLRRDSKSDILTLISQLPTDEEKERALQVVYEEEMKGCERQSLRPGLHDFIHELRSKKIRMALCTRNCEHAYLHFLDKTSFETNVFDPALWRDCLGGLNKPDPALAKHVMERWNILPGKEGTVWFVGDSMDDMECGKRAGCKTCLITTSYNRDLQQKHPDLVDVVVETLAELLVVVGLRP